MNRPSSLLLVLACLAAPVPAAEPPPSQGTLIELSAEATGTAANDLARATLFAEGSDPHPAEIAKRVNGAIAAALRTVKAYPNVKARSGASHTYPNYGKGGNRIESWRMRSELMLETRDMTALSDLLGKLQATLGVASIALAPAPDTRAKAEEQATLDAISAFHVRAKLVAGAMGSPFRIRQMSIQGSGRPPVVPVMRSAVMAEAAAPIEAGESTVSVSVSGQIELLDGKR